MGIDIWEVIEAASTKPFGFMPFYPGAGVGGHCIPVDPFYLSWKAREFDFYTRFVELSAEINDNMPFHAVDLVSRALDAQGKSTRDARVLVLGVAFKRNVDDARNSPARRVIELLRAKGAEVAYHDPYVPGFETAGTLFGLRSEIVLQSQPLTAELLRAANAVVIITPHKNIDLDLVVREAPLLIDTTGVTRRAGRSDIWRLGAPSPLRPTASTS
jgi:UDP-N-acetyl-D-glucosamine dehydrogenase